MQTKLLLITAALTPALLNGQKSVFEFVPGERGFLVGQTDGKVDRFLSVPYAAPPIGDRRWKAPVEPRPWYGVRGATTFASKCPQSSLAGGPVAGSEDCLYLNIYRPSGARFGSLLPVLVFIHGGSNVDGAGSDLDPSAIAARNILVVTFNYRLGVFGFLSHPSLDAETGEPSSGNFGLMDQQAAIRWVRRNILAFGGDPRAITVGGESAGGIDLCAQLTSPGADGLFRRAILQSAYCDAISHEEAIQSGVTVAAAVGCSDSSAAAGCLRTKSTSDLVKAANLPPSPETPVGFEATPNFGNRLLPVEPAIALNTGRWNRANVLLGANRDEAALFVLAGLAAANVPLPLSAEDYRRLVEAQFGPLASAVLSEYPVGRYPDPFLAYSAIMTDISPLGCALTPLSNSIASTADLHRYEFEDRSAPLPDALSGIGISAGAYHASELQYLFKVVGYSGSKTIEQQQLSRQMLEYWTNFVKTGNPNGPDLPQWPLYDAVARKVLSLRPGATTVIDNLEAIQHCQFWSTVPLDSAARNFFSRSGAPRMRPASF